MINFFSDGEGREIQQIIKNKKLLFITRVIIKML
jgi:hypothetical protein